MVSVKVWCRVDELEKEEKVRKALENMFPTLVFKREGDLLEGRGKRKDLEFIRDLIWSKRILDTVRNELMKRFNGVVSEFLLHKQAAYVGKLGLVESDSESPFGAIHVEIESKNFEEFLDWFSPRTKDGKPILSSKNQL